MRFGALLLLAGCEGMTLGTGTNFQEVGPAFDRECFGDGDCVVVPDGAPCSCICRFSAISIADKEEFDLWWSELNQDCPLVVCPPCAEDAGFVLPACEDGTCVVVEPGDTGLPPGGIGGVVGPE